MSRLVLAAVVVLTALALVGYAVAGDVVPAPGGVYVEGVVGAPRYLNPLLATPGSPDEDVCALAFEGLTRVQPDGKVDPALATDWSVDPSGKVYSFKLRRDVRWHDGSSFGADDVLATVRALQANDFPGDPSLAAAWRGITAEATADGVRLTLPEPSAWFPEQASIGILPAATANALRGRAGLEAEANHRPVGTGPFRVVTGELRRVELTAWEGYYDEPPLVRGVEMRFFGGADAALAALRRGELTAVRPIELPETAVSAAQQAGAAVYQLPERGKTVELLFGTRNGPFDDAATRGALAAAIDRGRVAATQPAAVAIEGAAPGSAQAGREALERAGWKDMDKEGTRQREGRPLRFTIVTNDRPERVAAAEELARQLGQVGARVEVQSVGWTGMVADVLQAGRFQAALVETYDANPVGDPSAYWGSKGALNFGGWAGPRAEEMLGRARSATSPAARAAALRDFGALQAAESPAVPLFNPRLTYLVAPELRGQSAPRLVAPRDRFASMNGWYLMTRRAPGRF